MLDSWNRNPTRTAPDWASRNAIEPSQSTQLALSPYESELLLDLSSVLFLVPYIGREVACWTMGQIACECGALSAVVGHRFFLDLRMGLLTLDPTTKAENCEPHIHVVI